MKKLTVCAILMFGASAAWASNPFVDNVSTAATAPPEPATFVLIGGVLLGLGLTRRRRA